MGIPLAAIAEGNVLHVEFASHQPIETDDVAEIERKWAIIDQAVVKCLEEAGNELGLKRIKRIEE